VALNNQTGEVVWEKKLGDYKTGEIFTSMPMVVKGKLLIGNSGMVPTYKDGVAPPPKPGSGPSFTEFKIS